MMEFLDYHCISIHLHENNCLKKSKEILFHICDVNDKDSQLTVCGEDKHWLNYMVIYNVESIHRSSWGLFTIVKKVPWDFVYTDEFSMCRIFCEI